MATTITRPRAASSLKQALYLMLLLPAVVCAQQLTVAAGNSMPPYVIPASQNGIALERLRAALSSENIELDLVFGSNADNLNAYQTGIAEAMLVAPMDSSGLFITRTPIAQMQNVAISLKPLPLQQISDLKPYRIGAFSLAHRMLPQPFAETAADSPEYREYPRQLEQVTSLFSGDNDVLVMERSIFRYYFSQLRQLDPGNPAYQQKPRYYPLFPTSLRHTGLSDPSMRDKLDRGLKRLQQSGEYDRIRERYERLMDEYLLR